MIAWCGVYKVYFEYFLVIFQDVRFVSMRFLSKSLFDFLLENWCQYGRSPATAYHKIESYYQHSTYPTLYTSLFWTNHPKHQISLRDIVNLQYVSKILCTTIYSSMSKRKLSLINVSENGNKQTSFSF